ncbi:allantoicase [Kwoniella shandongensis]|uniref:Allantoicase n=1 Tax=Kwoniella shandongensis TaxID=1734106 RepID=A0A5M6BVB1_9TREE|nr:allantoicase [Kwoniella shandongensis]KAA5526693.1 allantoicase [Kwoniella shandongensis]
MSSTTPISLEEFDSNIKTNFIEVSSAALGGQVVACSDDFFASRHNLIKPTPSISLKGQFGPNGALYDGWESRRHSPSFDWVIIRLATPLTSLHYVDIDTSHFSGNEAPQSQVFALSLSSTPDAKLVPSNPDWVEVLPVVDLGPNSRHVFEVGSAGKQGNWGAVMVRMIPDGGMARFRAYGLPHAPSIPTSLPENYHEIDPVNLLSPLIGARIISCSDANFSPPQNLLLPGRGFDMSDGWETRRSQEGRGKYAIGGPLEGQERKEWVVAKLGVTGVIRWVEVDTAFHPGNYPAACAIEATLVEDGESLDNAKWTTVVAKKPLGPHRQHFFDIERNVPQGQVFSHIRYDIFPDGGSKRVRIFGHPLTPTAESVLTLPSDGSLTIPTLPLTPEVFKPYGQVIQGHSLPTSAPKGVPVTIANQGTAFKFHRLGKVEESYPAGTLTKGGLHVGSVKAQSKLDIKDGLKLEVTVLERHQHTTQAFIPMGRTPDASPPGAFIVVVALNGADDKPDLSTVRAFIATAAQGVTFDQGIWHHSLLTVGGDLDYAVIEAVVPNVLDPLYLEKVAPSTPLYLQIPPFPPKNLPAGSLVNANIPHPPPVHHAHPQAHVSAPTPHHLLPSLASLLPHMSQNTTTAQVSSQTPVPLTATAFKPFGHVITPTPDASHTDFESAPDGKTRKNNRLAPIVSTYPENSGAITGISVFRATKKVGLARGKTFDVRYMERHKYTSQAFIPMGKAEWAGKGEEALEAGGEFLVIVAENGPDDRPDPKTLKSFIMPANMGLSYSPGVWHHPVLVLDSTLDLACVETQISTGVHEADERDCELLSWEGAEVFGKVDVPEL